MSVCAANPVYEHLEGNAADYLAIDDGDGVFDMNWTLDEAHMSVNWTVSDEYLGISNSTYETSPANPVGSQEYLNGVYEHTTSSNNTNGDMLLAQSVYRKDAYTPWQRNAAFGFCGDPDQMIPDEGIKGWAARGTKWVPALLWWAGDRIHAAFSFTKASFS